MGVEINIERLQGQVKIEKLADFSSDKKDWEAFEIGWTFGSLGAIRSLSLRMSFW